MYAQPEPDEFDQDEQSQYEDFITEACLHNARKYRAGMVSFEDAVQNVEAVYHEFTEDGTPGSIVFPQALLDFRACIDAMQDMEDTGFTGGEIV